MRQNKMAAGSGSGNETNLRGELVSTSTGELYYIGDLSQNESIITLSIDKLDSSSTN